MVLAGGRGSRLGGIDKPGLDVGGRSLIERVLAALGPVPVVVVGPPRPLGRDVTVVRENPPGSGPAAAVAAGIRALDDNLPADTFVALLAADLPAVDRRTLGRLAAVLVTDTGSDGAILLDPAGRRQTLLGVWRLGPLREACGRQPDWTGAALHQLLRPLNPQQLPAIGDEAADIDTTDDLVRWQRG